MLDRLNDLPEAHPNQGSSDDEITYPSPGKLFKDHNGALYVSMTVKSFCKIRDYTGYPVFDGKRREWEIMEKAWLRQLEVLDL